MTNARATNPKQDAVGRLFVLELSGGRIHSMSADGSNRKVIVADCHLPDGVAVDVEAGHIYWTNMGVPNLDDGSIECANLDGTNRKIIIPRESRSPQSRFTWRRGAASSTGATAKACG